ncbi:cobalamin-binding protein [Viridibacterium curvum]|uniref:Cobalamin-binding protein n=1 Tax=Viridibacterium curvum TaxID=1101404 RepID=A0ABP9QIR9_9RHOO
MTVVVLLALSGVGIASAASITVKDDTNQTLTLDKPAQRVISLAPSLTEIVFAIGAGDKLVGAIDYSDYPAAALKVPRIGSNQRLDLERIAALKPDLVLVWHRGNALREVEKLRTLGIPMFYIEAQDIADLPGVMQRLGVLLGVGPSADEAAQRFRHRHDKLRSTYAGRKPLRVFYQIGDKPLLTINDRQIISDVIRLCGGINVFGKEPMTVPQLSTESVIAADPDVIFTARKSDGDPAAKRADANSRLTSWQTYPGMMAVKNRQLWMVSGDEISRHGPRILDAAEAVCAVLEGARR